MKWSLKGGISIDADSGPLGCVLWCCGSICHQFFTFIHIGSGHTVKAINKKIDFLDGSEIGSFKRRKSQGWSLNWNSSHLNTWAHKCHQCMKNKGLAQRVHMNNVILSFWFSKIRNISLNSVCSNVSAFQSTWNVT